MRFLVVPGTLVDLVSAATTDVLDRAESSEADAADPGAGDANPQ
jgi:hypothetical protein